MDEILEGLSGCVGIADDICIFGVTEDEHDQRLIALMEKAKTHGLVFNSEKCTIKRGSISFFGNVYSANGVSPDPAKLKDIHSMPRLQNKDDLQRLLGLMTYLGSFIPNLSSLSYTLRDLLKENTQWTWDTHHQRPLSG